MSNFVGRPPPPLLKFAMGCHRNHAILHSPNQILFEDTFVSHSGGPNEQFGTHEKLSWGVQGNLNWMPGYRDFISYLSDNNQADSIGAFNSTLRYEVD